jgi:hypothetical protein
MSTDDNLYLKTDRSLDEVAETMARVLGGRVQETRIPGEPTTNHATDLSGVDLSDFNATGNALSRATLVATPTMMSSGQPARAAPSPRPCPTTRTAISSHRPDQRCLIAAGSRATTTAQPASTM